MQNNPSILLLCFLLIGLLMACTSAPTQTTVTKTQVPSLNILEKGLAVGTFSDVQTPAPDATVFAEEIISGTPTPFVIY